MTEKRYTEKLKELQTHCPHSPFLPSLRRGYSVVNVVYLQKAFEKMGGGKLSDASKASDNSEHLEASDNLYDIPIDDTLRYTANDAVLSALDLERRALYRDLFVTRKRFFDFAFTPTFDNDRADVSDDVQAIQRKIGRLKTRIEVYINTGVLPEAEAEKGEKVFEIPSNPYERMKKLNSLAAGLSRAERELKQMVGMGAGEREEKVLKKQEQIMFLRGSLNQLKGAIREAEGN